MTRRAFEVVGALPCFENAQWWTCDSTGRNMRLDMARWPVRWLAAALMCMAAVGGCISFSTKTTGAATIEDLQAEENYKAVYAMQMANVQAQMALFAPSGSNPGVCNVGGTKQGCYDADADAIEAFRGLISALEAIRVPPRFVEADRLLREAFAENIRGLELRNEAIANNDNAAWIEHKTVLESAQAAIVKAYAAFPADNPPMPLRRAWGSTSVWQRRW